MLIRSLGLSLEHGYVGLETLVDFALSLDLRLHGLQVFQLHKVRLKAFCLVLLGDLAGGTTDSGSGFLRLLGRRGRVVGLIHF